MRRLLYLTQTKGFRHGCLELSHKVIRELAPKSGFEVTITENAADVNRANLDGYDAVMFYTTGELPMTDDDKKALLEFVRKGKGFIGIHSATDTYYQWPEYGELIGAWFDGHPWSQEVNIIVEDTKHPTTAHLGKAFRLLEEVYQYRNWSRAKTHVLLSLDNDSVDVSKGKREDKDNAMAWCHAYGKGRVFFTGLGHYDECWNDERFHKHLVNGIRWAMGDLPGAAPLGTPRPRK
jgi:type 1 glutamine amidotransferase